MDIIKIIILSLSGLLLVFVGISRMSNPIMAYLKNSGIKLAEDVDLLNEMRGIGSLMLIAGIIVLLSILIPQLALSSHIIGALIFLGFMVGRLISMSKDGKPNKKITQGIIFELVLGLVNVFGLWSSWA